jgi:hypothetical protein
MSLSDRNPYEVHAELLRRIERLETNDDLATEIRSFTELLQGIDRKDLTLEEKAALSRLYDLLTKIEKEN